MNDERLMSRDGDEEDDPGMLLLGWLGVVRLRQAAHWPGLLACFHRTATT